MVMGREELEPETSDTVFSTPLAHRSVTIL
jgi:hypothetical protein